MHNVNKPSLRSYTVAISRLLEGWQPLRERAMATPLAAALRPHRAHVMELGLILGLYLVYLLTRGLVHSDAGVVGLANAGRIIDAEKSLGIFLEPGMQSWVLTHAPGLAVFFNWTYVFTYWPVILLVGLALYVANRPRYYYFRTVMAVNLVFALLIFMFFPVTSPFNFTQYFANTIQELGPSFYGSPEMGALYNSHAAMPSLHFSWTVILGVLFIRSFRGWMRPVGVAYPAVTLMAITVTGNHFFLDAVVGGALALVSFGLVELGPRGGLARCRAGLDGLWRELSARRIPAASRYEAPVRAKLEGLRREPSARRVPAAPRYEAPARAKLEGLRREPSARRVPAASRYEAPVRAKLEELWRNLGARRIPAASRYEAPARFKLERMWQELCARCRVVASRYEAPLWAKLEELRRDLCARCRPATSRYEAPARANLEELRREFRRLEAGYSRWWSQTQGRTLSEVRRNWMYYRVAWLRLKSRLPLVFRRPTTWGGGRYS